MNVFFDFILHLIISFFLEERKRNQVSDEQRRDREKADLEILVERHGQLVNDFSSTPSLSRDGKLWVLDKKIREESTHMSRLIADDKSTQEERNEQYMKVLDLCEELQRHLNKLINQTYK